MLFNKLVCLPWFISYLMISTAPTKAKGNDEEGRTNTISEEQDSADSGPLLPCKCCITRFCFIKTHLLEQKPRF